MNSASGLVALLQEEDARLQQAALEKLHVVLDQHWAEVADEVTAIETLSEDPDFPARELAAIVASKCFYHLEEYSDALRLALGAGTHFDVAGAPTDDEYVSTMIAKCIDEYVELRVREAETGEPVEIDPRLTAIVERMFQRCYDDGQYNHAIGTAVSAHRLDVLRTAIQSSGAAIHDCLAYAFDVAQNVVTSHAFRSDVLRVLVELYNGLETPDLINLARCHQYLDDTEAVVALLLRLARSGTEADILMAYQIGFDLTDNDNQQFLYRITSGLPVKAPTAAATDGDDGDKTGEDGATTTTTTTTAAAAAGEESDEFWVVVGTLRSILDGTHTLALNIDFLFRHNNTDLLLLERLKKATEGGAPSADNRASVLHHATVVSHGLMFCGTANDNFLRDNLAWLAKATNWGRFSATASQGMVHKGNLGSAMKLLEPYLPNPANPQASPYSEGGALYALGLMHAAKGASSGGEVVSYLINALQSNQHEVIQHGAALGLGLASMGTGTETQFTLLLDTLSAADSAVAGEAAGMSIGLLLMGRLREPIAGMAVTEMLSYAHETKHEKIIRGLALGLGFVAYGQEEHADALVEQMIRDKDPVIRYGGVYALSLAYVGTSANPAIRKLLHIAVSDVNDDVRRAAVTGLGFVLLRTPEQVPRLVSLLAESYNPHVRYGACIAIGIACANTGSDDALRLLTPMLDDVSDFVRQGALLAMAMVLQQVAEGRQPKVKEFRDKLATIVSDKHFSTMTKMGAVLAQGLIDAGGRNVSVSLRSHAGFVKSTAVVGMVGFLQYWYWYPYMHFVSLALAPTAVIGVTADLKLPADFKLHCAAKPSEFAYPEKLTIKKEEKKERVATVELSTTAKAKAKARAKAKEEDGGGGGAMDTEDGDADDGKDGAGAGATEEKKEEGVEETKADAEPASFTISNPARVTPSQVETISFLTAQRWVPVRDATVPTLGIVLLRDTNPGAPAEYVRVKKPGEEEPDRAAPADFEWTPPKSG